MKLGDQVNSIHQSWFARHRQQILLLLILLIVPLIGFWQVSLFQFTMKWDIMDQALPWRYYISECFQSGYLPAWNPYENLGYPMFADPLSGSWYPVVWLISATTGYTVYSIQFEFVFHILLAGVGMYLFARSFGLSQSATLIIAICFQGSGFMVGNAQHLSWIIAASWIPFVLLFYHKATSNKSIPMAIATSLCMFMLLSGGYPAFSIITHYILLIVFIISIARALTNSVPVGKLLLINLLIYGGFLLLSAGFILSFYEVLPYITREEIQIHQALHGSFTLPSLISLILPFSISGANQVFQTDISMRNIYFGLLPLLVLFPTIWMNKSNRYKMAGLFGILCLMVALGNILPVREWLFNYVPMMDTFRFPAIFRLFSILGFLLYAGYGIQRVFDYNELHRKKFAVAFAGLAILLISAIIIAITKGGSLVIPNMFSPLRYDNYLANSSTYDQIIFQGIFQLLVLGGMAWAVFKIKEKVFRIRAFTMIILIDILASVWVNQPMTVTTYAKPAKFQEQINHLPEGFPIPDMGPMNEKTDNDRYIFPVWSNMGIFHKITAVDGYNAFRIKSYDHFMESDTRDSILKNPLLWFSNKMVSLDNSKSQSSEFSHKTIIVPSGFEGIDSNLTTQYILPEITHFGPSFIEAKVNTPVNGIVVLLQNNLPGWTATVNNIKQIIVPVNSGFIGVQVFPGEQTVRFEYKPKWFRESFFFTIGLLSAFILALLILVYSGLKTRPVPVSPQT